MKERNNKMELLGNAPIPKALMALGIPIMIGMLINALYNLVDAYFVGGLGESCKRQVLSSKKWQLISSIFWQLSTSILYTPTDFSVGIFY